MIDVNLKYDCRDLGWYRRSLFGSVWLRQEKEKRLRKFRRLGLAGLSLWLAGLAVAIVPSLPKVGYALAPEATEAIAETLSRSDADVAKSEFGEVIYEPVVYVPPFDASLPQENTLIIEKIGFESQIREAPVEQIEEALRQGPWRVPELGTPEKRDAPIILAAHRFGYIYWSNQFRRQNSFYNLPKLENGDLIEVVWNQRKYTYEVYEGYTDTKIRDYGADLILYTCEVLNSPRRIIRAARLVVPEEMKEAQSKFGTLVSLSAK